MGPRRCKLVNAQVKTSGDICDSHIEPSIRCTQPSGSGAAPVVASGSVAVSQSPPADDVQLTNDGIPSMDDDLSDDCAFDAVSVSSDDQDEEDVNDEFDVGAFSNGVIRMCVTKRFGLWLV